MKTILLHANGGPGLESRLQVALDAVRLFEGHLVCVQSTPFDAFIVGDPFGGIYTFPAVLDGLRKAEEAHRASLEGRLRKEGVSWDWLRYDGDSAQVIVDRARLCDLIVVSLGESADAQGHATLAAEVALHARSSVLAVPQDCRSLDCCGPAVIAWDGSLESAHALRLAMPMLRKAGRVLIVTVDDDAEAFPATDASLYLARQGLDTELHQWARSGRSTAETLTEAAAVLGADYLVMGAYGHSRLRETILGGTTRDMLRSAKLPLLIAH